MNQSRLGLLRELRWGHFAIELALLVAGILIALMVDGWIDDRREDRAERQYLELLVRDLDRDLEELGDIQLFEEAQAAASALAYRALKQGVAVDDREAVAVALGQLTARRTLRLGRATYTELLSTGNLRIIGNTALRDRIVRLYETNERAQVIRDRNNQEFVDRMYMTHLLDHGLVAPRPVRNLPRIASPDQKYSKRVGAGVQEGTSDDRLWRMSPEDPEWAVLAGRVWYRGLASESALDQSQQIAEEIRTVRQAIEDELSARQWP